LGENEENTGQEEERKTSSRLWTPHGDPRKPDEGGGEAQEAQGEPGEEVSDEELRRRIEEAMEKITVTDVVVDMMVSLSSLAYQRMGIPHEVNEKFRNMDQARLAIDCLEALFKSLEGRVPEDLLVPLTGTLDNLKLNFAKES
jgi:hypothetical protein